MNKKLGLKLREQRKKRGMSIAQLAETCNISYEYLRQIELGNKLPSLPLVLTMCDVLNTTPNYLFGFVSQDMDSDFMKRVYQLSPKEQEFLLHFMDFYIDYQNKGN